jgi:hypothetical protein
MGSRALVLVLGILAIAGRCEGIGTRYWYGRESYRGTTAVFSDIDGTLVHYPGGRSGFAKSGVEVVEEDDERMRSVLKGTNGELRECKMCPSSTMGNGHISLRCAQYSPHWLKLSTSNPLSFRTRVPDAFEPCRQQALTPCEALCSSAGSARRLLRPHEPARPLTPIFC